MKELAPRKKRKKSDSSVTSAILASAVAALATLVVVLRLWNYVPLAVVSSWSMDPVLHVGDIVVVFKTDSYSAGDIALYRNYQGTIIIHRVINETLAGSYIMKGDANAHEDIYRPRPEDMLGKAVVVIPYVGVYRLLLPVQLP